MKDVRSRIRPDDNKFPTLLCFDTTHKIIASYYHPLYPPDRTDMIKCSATTSFAYLCAICIFISRGRGEIRRISDFIYTLIQVSSVCIKMILHRPQVHTSLNRDKEISFREMGTRPRRPLYFASLETLSPEH